ncbi:MAG: pentapeptide repeat-containing protein [Geminicoccales bacterium]
MALVPIVTRNSYCQSALRILGMARVRSRDDEEAPLDVRKLEQNEWLSLVQKGLPIEGVDLSNIDLAETDLDGVRLVDCLAMQANYTSAQLAGSYWTGCQLPASTFASGQLQGTVFEDCRFLDPEASNGCKFRFCNMVDACFRNCDLSLASFYSCDLYSIAFEACRMRGASIEKSDFSKSFGRKIVRTNACFKDCDLEYASLSNANLSSCEFNGSDLTRADLTHANLANAKMEGCDLTDAELRDADLSGANLCGGKLDGLNLFELQGYSGLTISADQQHKVLRELGIEVSPD